ncbi:MAG: acyltransferase [Clostridiales Family XIII bacterium]|jgi:maltose O-acetyltransferase|nr:acyltransferase [Clostridiales Family XIII bacterium]
MIGVVQRVLSRIRGEEPTAALIGKGLRVGAGFSRGDHVVIDSAHCWLIRFGDHVRLEPYVHILAHDATAQFHYGYTRIAPVEIGDNVWIGTGVLVMPGVTIGDNVIICAGSIVSKDIPPGITAAGIPARKVGDFHEYMAQIKAELETAPRLDEKWARRGGVTAKEREEMFLVLKEAGAGYVR